MSLIEKISKYSKEQFIKISKQINLKKDYKISFKKINNNDELIINEDKKMIASCSYHFFGYYDKKTKIWHWANITPGISKSRIKYINELKAKAYLIEKNINSEIDLFFYQFLSNDYFKIVNDKQLALITDLLIWLSNDYHIFKPIDKNDNIEFIGLSKINQLYV